MKTKKLSKILATILTLCMILSVCALPAFAATPSGTVTVNSRYSGDNSVKQVTLTMNSNWSTDNGGTISGTLRVTFPQGYYYGTPSAEDVWYFVVNSTYYNGNYGYDYNYNYGNNNGYNYNNTTHRTAAQIEAEARLTDLRTAGENWGWSVDWVPSKTTTANDWDCWYACTAYRMTTVQDRNAYGFANTTNNVSFQFSVHTWSENGYWNTNFNIYQNGSLTSSMTLAETQNLLSDYKSQNGSLPLNVFQTNSVQNAANSMLNYLRNTSGLTVNVQGSNYYGSPATATLQVRRGTGSYRTIVMTVEWRDNSTYRCSFTENGYTLPIRDIVNM